MGAALDLQGVAKVYGRTAALKATTLTLEEGQTLALLGPNGSGKTTLLKVVAGVTHPTLGRGTILGRDMVRERAALRTEIGFLAAESYLYEDLTARENLRFLTVMAGRRLEDRMILDVLDAVHLGAQQDERVRNFSSGMRRRLSLARLLLLRPPLILLDEPYNSMDEEGAELIDLFVRETVNDGGAAVVATHDAARGLSLADAVAFMERGHLTYYPSAERFRQGQAHHVG